MAYGSVNVPGVTQADLLEVRRKDGYYGVCATNSNIAAKTVSVDNTFALESGVEVTVKFSYTHKGSSPTLNVNGTGAKSIYYKGSTIPYSSELPSGWYYYIQAGGIYVFRYNGDGYWELIGDLYQPIAPAANFASTAYALSQGLDIQFNGTSQGNWKGNSNKTVNITPSGIGAAEYEEGEWTPKVYDKNNNEQPINNNNTWIFKRVGNVVFLNATVNFSSGYLTQSNVVVKNLPFPIINTTYQLNGSGAVSNPSTSYVPIKRIYKYSSGIEIDLNESMSFTSFQFSLVYETNII